MSKQNEDTNIEFEESKDINLGTKVNSISNEYKSL